jgi:beta-glucanase (GH16 family)
MHPLVAALALALARAASASCAPPAAAVAGSWVLTFEDDFAGDALNTSTWTASNYSSVISEYDGHAALFTAERVTVANGSLVLTTVWDPQEFAGVRYNMTSGWVDSQHKRNQTKGRFEASIKMPDARATGAWPAWWLLPEGACWPISGEIDIVEWYAGRGHFQHSRPANPAQMSSSYHWGYSCGGDLYTYPNDTVWWPSGDWTPDWPIVDFSADFHVFGVELNETALRFYVDNSTNTIRTFELPPLCLTDPDFVWGETAYMPFKPLYGILNVAVAEDAGANLTWWLDHNATTLVDWVRWYEFVPAEAAVDAARAIAPPA